MIEQVTKWANGDVAQGKVMLFVGAIVLVAAILAWKNGGEMLRGMLIPLGLIVFINVGYGGFMQRQRPGIVKQVSERYAVDPVSAQADEVARIEKDCRTYAMMNFIWSAFFIVGITLVFMAGANTWKGLGLGFIVLSAAGFVLDNFLHERAEVYLKAIA
ncbi:MAG: hypothetical protein WEC15_07150 [Flavobacteriales bacterium]